MRLRPLTIVSHRFLLTLTASCVWMACGDDGTTTGTGGGGGDSPTTTTTTSTTASSSTTGSSGGGGEAPNPTCTDGLANGNETDVDCGGPECPKCPDGSGCETGADCTSGVCDNGTCAAPSCGDGVVNQASEDCDDGNADDTDACVDGCVDATCGDGFVQAGVEGCDDGNMDDTDACLTTCVSATCGDGFVDAGTEECDDANGDNTDACLDTCLAATCGDGFTQTGIEDCDDANADNTDACLDTCVDASCGDGFVYAGTEECDDGVANSDTTPDACRTTCVLPACGDTVIDSGEVCDDGNVIADLTCGADCSTVCGPLAGSCNGSISTYCASDGSAVLTEVCDPLQGKACDAGTGLCTGNCADRLWGENQQGCDFQLSDMKQFSGAPALRGVFTNPGAAAANLTVTQGGTTVATFTVPANGSLEQAFNTLSAIRQGDTVHAPDGSFRIRSTEPINAFVHNVPGGGAGDSSLLHPALGWGTDHYVGSYTPLSGYPSVYTVTARQDNTVVTLTPRAGGPTVVANAGIGVTATGSGTVTLNADDILQVVATGTGDLSGTRVQSTLPVTVAGGVACAQVPNGTTFCDHLEETMPSVATLGTQYLVAPAPAAGGFRPSIVRIIATQPNTTLSYEPAQAGAPASIPAAGSFVDYGPNTAAYGITASAKVLVLQYYPGNGLGGVGQGSGDPAMVVLTPVGQLQNAYTISTSSGYTNYVSLVLVSGSSVLVDGLVVTTTAIGASGFDFANVPVSSANHTITCSGTCAGSLVGVGSVDSYWHRFGAGFNPL